MSSKGPRKKNFRTNKRFPGKNYTGLLNTNKKLISIKDGNNRKITNLLSEKLGPNFEIMDFVQTGTLIEKNC